MTGLRVHRLLLGGIIPGRTLYTADFARLDHVVGVLARDIERLPELPDFAAMDALLTTATAAILEAAGESVADGELPRTRLSVLTRAALSVPDAASFVRLLERSQCSLGRMRREPPPAA